MIVQQIPSVTYAGTVLTFTYQVASLGQIAWTESSVVSALSRIVHIAGALVWVIVVSWIVVPFRAGRKLRMQLLDSFILSAKIFNTIIQHGLVECHGVSHLSEEARVDAEASLVALHKALPSLRAFIIEAGPELYMTKHANKAYMDASRCLDEVYAMLVMLYTAYGRGFSSALTQEVVEPLQDELRRLLKPMQSTVARATRIKMEEKKDISYWPFVGICIALSQKKLLNSELADHRDITFSLDQIDTHYRDIRQATASHLAHLHPEFIHFQALMYTILRFTQEWEALDTVMTRIMAGATNTLEDDVDIEIMIEKEMMINATAADNNNSNKNNATKNNLASSLPIIHDPLTKVGYAIPSMHSNSNHHAPPSAAASSSPSSTPSIFRSARHDQYSVLESSGA
eukprot:TRINITY_DN6860_c0_g1_i3.p1 TRINITY_DN6860_c0_g1~~TRINITY_DN6860_c0_g1_i3.p1  ORF type:complete len:400 (-),score=66.81 TRINITY_DN6860_c0_g1_i3:45-1244(-)